MGWSQILYLDSVRTGENRLLYVFPVITCTFVAFDLQNGDTFYQLRNPIRNIGITRVLWRLNYRRLASLNHDSRQARSRLMFFFLTILRAEVYIMLKYWSTVLFDAKSSQVSMLCHPMAQRGRTMMTSLCATLLATAWRIKPQRCYHNSRKYRSFDNPAPP